MAQSRGSSRGMVKVALSALLAVSGALLSVTGCSSEVSEGSGGTEAVGVVGQYLVKYCTNPITKLKVNCGEEETACGTVVCVQTGNGCGLQPKAGSDGSACLGGNDEKGVCAAGECCTGCTRQTGFGREEVWECFKPSKLNCGLGGRTCDACTDKLCAKGECSLKGECEYSAVEDKTPCSDDSGLCLGGSCCRGCINKEGACVAGNTVNECGRTTPQTGFDECEDCDQGNICSNYSCVMGACAPPQPASGACPDGNICNGQEACGNNNCNPGTPLSCTDNDPCTNNNCDPMAGCTTSPNTGANCSDNSLCTITDKCAAGECKGTGTPNCDDNNPCTIDSCDPAKGCTHEPAPDNDPCSDGNDCSTGDKCVAGKCLANGGKMCEDNNSCTKNECDAAAPGQPCSFPNEDNGTPCVHVNKCKQNSTCQSGTCNAGPDIVCDDANPCTKNECDPAVGCVFPADDTATCSDGDACTTDDACDNKVCEGKPVACTALDDCHVAGTCNPESGKCDDPRADDGTECMNGGPGTCDDGKCVLLPVGGAGGDSGTGEGGEPAMVGGNGSTAEGGRAEPAAGSGGTGATPGAEAGATGEPGEPGDEDEHEFVRQPGGCSCRTPGSGSANSNGNVAWLAGLALAAMWVGRRRQGQDRRILP